MTYLKIILIGMKGCGKSTVGKLLAEKLNIQFIELDDELEKEHFQAKKKKLNFREIYRKYGQEYFRKLESSVLKGLVKRADNNNYILACGGGTPLNFINQKILKQLGKVIYLKPDRDALYKRIISGGIPAFFANPNNPISSFNAVLKYRNPVYEKLADITLKCKTMDPEQIVKMIQLQ